MTLVRLPVDAIRKTIAAVFQPGVAMPPVETLAAQVAALVAGMQALLPAVSAAHPAHQHAQALLRPALRDAPRSHYELWQHTLILARCAQALLDLTRESRTP
ncbi:MULTISPECIES: hypothetical protein [Streptomyces]|uniref:Uncharacterized protein n=2 Tax=Streptomyces TaxID=1883 RepID=A0A0W7WW68_9ACTN|nr:MULTISPECIES: hypothetical protein [Streptomyces]KUF14829.1 hypothetical protein AT728_35685 [Streptomyces silvensis]MVO84551.1 hypothetical protein [Streptomyces typhae]